MIETKAFPAFLIVHQRRVRFDGAGGEGKGVHHGPGLVQYVGQCLQDGRSPPRALRGDAEKTATS
jgi:hypothetical protein